MKFCNVFSEIMHHGKLNSMVGSQRRLSAVVLFPGEEPPLAELSHNGGIFHACLAHECQSASCLLPLNRSLLGSLICLLVVLHEEDPVVLSP